MLGTLRIVATILFLWLNLSHKNHQKTDKKNTKPTLLSGSVGFIYNHLNTRALTQYLRDDGQQVKALKIFRELVRAIRINQPPYL